MKEAAKSVMEEPVLGRGVLFAFVLPTMMMGLMHSPEGQLQGIYAKYSGLSLGALATATLITRLFDAITYPLIGYLSDLTARRPGGRKVWIVVGTAVTVGGLWFLFRPPRDVSIIYFTCWFTVVYVGWKLTEIPYSAWSMSITRDYVQRARVQVWRSMASLSGGFVYLLIPLLSQAFGWSATAELNLQSLALTAIVVLVCAPLVNLYALARVPEGEAAPRADAVAGAGSIAGMVRAMAGNQPFLRLLAAFIPITLFGTMSSGVTFLYVDAYMGLGKQLAAVALVALPSTVLGLTFWGWLCLRFERHKVWAVSMVLGAASFSGMSFVPFGQAGLYPLAILYALTVFCIVAAGVAAPAMMGDVVDYDRLQSGQQRAGVFSAILAFLSKSLAGAASALGLGIVSWLGFDASAKVQSAGGVFGIKLVMFGLPAVGFVLSAFLIWSFPLSRARQEEIRKAIRAQESVAAESQA